MDSASRARRFGDAGRRERLDPPETIQRTNAIQFPRLLQGSGIVTIAKIIAVSDNAYGILVGDEQHWAYPFGTQINEADYSLRTTVIPVYNTGDYLPVVSLPRPSDQALRYFILQTFIYVGENKSIRWNTYDNRAGAYFLG